MTATHVTASYRYRFIPPSLCCFQPFLLCSAKRLM